MIDETLNEESAAGIIEYLIKDAKVIGYEDLIDRVDYEFNKHNPPNNLTHEVFINFGGRLIPWVYSPRRYGYEDTELFASVIDTSGDPAYLTVKVDAANGTVSSCIT